MRQPKEYATFSKAMDTILRANPNDVKAAMDAEKNERAMEVTRTGKRGRGRPPKHSQSFSALGRAASEKD